MRWCFTLCVSRDTIILNIMSRETNCVVPLRSTYTYTDTGLFCIMDSPTATAYYREIALAL